jgi:hypothetical protein
MYHVLFPRPQNQQPGRGMREASRLKLQVYVDVRVTPYRLLYASRRCPCG